MAAQALDQLWWLLETLDGLDLALETMPILDVWEMLILLLLAALWLLPPGVPGRWLAAFALPLLLCRTVPVPGSGGLELTVLDVGQGLSVVARTSRHTLVFDTGPRYASGLDTGELVVVPFLRERAVRTVDVLLISHGDNDHAGGAASVIRAIKTTRIMSNADLPIASVRACREDQRWDWDGVEFEVLGPPHGARSDNNNNSCVLRIGTRSWQILIPGDIEKEAEEELLQRLGPAALAADVLVAPHHGSRTSSGRAFIAAVDPSHVIFSVGFRNRFGFPHPDVLARYHRLAVVSHDTVRDGAVSFWLRAGAPVSEPVLFRSRQRRFWNR